MTYTSVIVQSKFKKRKIRVTTCGKRTKRTEKFKNDKAKALAGETLAPSDASENADSQTSEGKGKRSRPGESLGASSTPSEGSRENPPPKKRKRMESESPAARRLKMKKALAQLAKKRNTGNRSGKPKGKKKLGGVIKTAIKMSKKAGK